MVKSKWRRFWDRFLAISSKVRDPLSITSTHTQGARRYDWLKECTKTRPHLSMRPSQRSGDISLFASAKFVYLNVKRVRRYHGHLRISRLFAICITDSDFKVAIDIVIVIILDVSGTNDFVISNFIYTNDAF